MKHQKTPLVSTLLECANRMLCGEGFSSNGPTAETQGCRAASAGSTSGGFPEPGREPGPKRLLAVASVLGPARPSPRQLFRQGAAIAWLDPRVTDTLSTTASPPARPRESLQPAPRHCPTCQASLSSHHHSWMWG